MKKGTVKKTLRGVGLLSVLGITYLMHLYLWVWERVKKRTIFAAY